MRRVDGSACQVWLLEVGPSRDPWASSNSTADNILCVVGVVIGQRASWALPVGQLTSELMRLLTTELQTKHIIVTTETFRIPVLGSKL